MLGDIPFVQRDDQRAALLQHLVGDPQILRLQPERRIEQQHDNLGEIHRMQCIRDGEFLQFILHLGLLAQAGGIDQPHRFHLARPARSTPSRSRSNRG